MQPPQNNTPSDELDTSSPKGSKEHGLALESKAMVSSHGACKEAARVSEKIDVCIGATTLVCLTSLRAEGIIDDWDGLRASLQECGIEGGWVY